MALGDIALMLQPVIDSATDLTGAFVPIGRIFLVVAMTIATLIATYEWWTGGAQAAIAKFVRALLIVSIPATLLFDDNYSSTMNKTRDFFAVELTKPLASGGSDASTTLRNTINTLTTSMFPRMKADPAPAPAAGGLVGWAKETWGNVTSPVDALFRLNVTMRQALYDLILMVVAFFVSLALISALYGPLFALQIGIIFGPLLFAWMPSPQFSHLARSWFQFILTQGFTLVVAVCIATVGATAITAFAEQMNGLAAAGISESGLFEALVVQTGGLLASLAVLVFVGFMLFRADNIAAAMIGGGGGGTSGIGGALLARVRTGGAKLPSGGGSGGGGGGGK